MPSARIASIAQANRRLIGFLQNMETQRRRPGTVDLTLGNPQELPIAGYVEALARQLPPVDRDSYAYHRSDPDARAVVAKRLIEWRGLAFEPDDIALTPGAFGALAIALDVLVDPGDEVIFSLPPWFLYEGMILGSGAVPVKVNTRAEDYDLDLDAIARAITPRTRVVIVNTPNNPTGRIYPPATLKSLAELLSERSSEREIYLLSDEPYSRLVFSDSNFASPSAFYDRTLISYSYGKVHLTPGQRLGWLAVNPAMPNRKELQALIEVAQVAGGWLFPNAVMQRALADLEHLSIDLGELERKRDLMLDQLSRMGYSLKKPEGTFYLWVRSPDSDDLAFCRRLADAGVFVLPGTVCEGPGHFRISLTASPQMLLDSLPAFEKVR
ncbi:MAG TPA: aminotransferase class I/II-fold pyridoxal phosphate-dependent enzyme [Acidimicrobiia bacterium]|jgi:aspartate aminotransferase|nr:aminotransferase class I/II-fold pyridoxal phosphate-dependent enzyme [Acidimicrobiia bacterium]